MGYINDDNKEKEHNIDKAVGDISRISQKTPQEFADLSIFVFGPMIKNSDLLEVKGKHHTPDGNWDDVCAIYAATYPLLLCLESYLKVHGTNDGKLEHLREIGKALFKVINGVFKQEVSYMEGNK
jgi:hypothetical protein